MVDFVRVVIAIKDNEKANVKIALDVLSKQDVDMVDKQTIMSFSDVMRIAVNVERLDLRIEGWHEDIQLTAIVVSTAKLSVEIIEIGHDSLVDFAFV